MSPSDSDNEFFRLNPFLERLRTELIGLSRPQLVAFSLHCCESLVPSIEAYSRSSGGDEYVAMRALLDDMWRALESEDSSLASKSGFEGRLSAIALNEDVAPNELDGAIDALGAVSLALEAWRSDENAGASSASKAAGSVLNRSYQELMDSALGTSYVLTTEQVVQKSNEIEAGPTVRLLQERLLAVARSLRIGNHYVKRDDVICSLQGS